MDIMESARYLIYLSYIDNEYSLTPLKLQKILYLAQGWSYVWDNRPLFQEEFEAWQYGPVNVRVYNYFKKYGRKQIPSVEGSPCCGADEGSKETLEAVWDNYGQYGSFELVELTHSQEPWVKAYTTNKKIKNSDIQNYFQAVY